MPAPFKLTCLVDSADTVSIYAEDGELSVITYAGITSVHGGPGTARALRDYLISVLDPTPSPAPATPAPAPAPTPAPAGTVRADLSALAADLRAAAADLRAAADAIAASQA